ncbi:MAG: hypothetical protein SGBAC_007383, partial [Bacillariaceae sp.]
MDSPEKLIQRHYGTIGIDDVFLNPPPHPLLSSYLQEDTPEESFQSWEVIGTIKSTPEDFIVREIFQSDRRIPGLTDDDHKTLQIADLLGPKTRPHQKFPTKQTPSQVEVAANDTVVDEGDSNCKTEQNVMESSTKVESNSLPESCRLDVDKSIESKLKILHDGAVKRLQHLAKGPAVEQGNDEVHAVWISLGISQKQDEMLHALRTKFPLLHSRSAEKDGSDAWLIARVDLSCDDLIPYLQCPEEDLSDLLRFHKQGNQESVSSTVADSVIVRLQHNVTKEKRKQFFDIFLAKFETFATRTISDYRKERSSDADGTSKATTAIAISWKKDESPRAVLRSYMKKAAKTRREADFDIISSLEKLNQVAVDRIGNMASLGSDKMTLDEESILIPPASSDSMGESARLERGVVFQALKSEFPLLQLDSVTKNEGERWIAVG